MLTLPGLAEAASLVARDGAERTDSPLAGKSPATTAMLAPTAPAASGAAGPAVVPAAAPVPVSLMALVAVDRAASFRVAWTGPSAPGDWIGIVPADSGAVEAVGNQPAAAGTPARLTAPGEAGVYEIVYVDGASGTVLARRELEVR